MEYPIKLEKGDLIGICAPSAGIAEDDDKIRLDYAINKIKSLGFNVIETDSVRKDEKGRSADAVVRANEFMSLYENSDVKAIIAAAGGDFLLEMIDHLDFKKIGELPKKWIVGYSDITGISFLLTTMLEIPTLYSQTIKDYAMEPWHKSLEDTFKIMMGEEVFQESFDKCEKVAPPEEFFAKDEVFNPTAGFKLSENVMWNNLYGESEINIKGRIIGGCFDLIKDIIGTKYDNVKSFIDKYKDDGIVWFLDIFESNTPEILRTILQMKNAGYFSYCKGILVGRALFVREDYEMDINEAIKGGLKDLNIPVITNMDIGHVAPQMPIVNGSIVEVHSQNGKGNLICKYL